MSNSKISLNKPKNILSFCLTLTIPVLYFFNLFFIWRFQETASFSFIFTVLGVILGSIGILLWGASFWELRHVFQVLPIKTKRVKKGVYCWLKHPMYTGIFLTFIGLGLSFQSKQGLLFTLFFIFPLLVARAWVEERRLVD